MARRILVVDDSDDMRDLLHIFLDGSKFRAVDAAGVDQALVLLDQQTFCAVVCDLNMPGRNGLDLLLAVKQHPVHRALPFLMLTGSNDRLEKKQCLDAGADAWITKPFSPSHIKAEIERLCPETA